MNLVVSYLKHTHFLSIFIWICLLSVTSSCYQVLLPLDALLSLKWFYPFSGAHSHCLSTYFLVQWSFLHRIEQIQVVWKINRSGDAFKQQCCLGVRLRSPNNWCQVNFFGAILELLITKSHALMFCKLSSIVCWRWQISISMKNKQLMNYVLKIIGYILSNIWWRVNQEKRLRNWNYQKILFQMQKPFPLCLAVLLLNITRKIKEKSTYINWKWELHCNKATQQHRHRIGEPHEHRYRIGNIWKTTCLLLLFHSQGTSHYPPLALHWKPPFLLNQITIYGCLSSRKA